MARSKQFWVAVVGAATAVALTAATPAAAQSGPSGPGGPTTTVPQPVPPLEVRPAAAPPGLTGVLVSGGCTQPTSSPIPVTLVGSGGTITAQARYSTANQRWNASLQVPWSTRPGPASVLWGCASPRQGPVAFTVQSADQVRPPAPHFVTAMPGNGFLDVFWDGTGGWSSVVVATVDGAVRHWQVVPPDLRRTAVPAVNGEDVQIQVFAVTAFAAGIPSAPITASASADGPARTPAGPPAGIGPGARVGSLTAYWFPTTSHGGSPVLGYSVIATRTGTGVVVGWQNVGPDVREASFDGLAPGGYDVHVLTVTDQGLGTAASKAVTVPSNGLAVETPAAPAEIALRHTAAGTVVNWRPGSDRGSPILAYAVIAYQNGGIVAWQNVGPDARTATLAGLRGSSLAPTVVQVMAYNRVGYGIPLRTYTGG